MCGTTADGPHYGARAALLRPGGTTAAGGTAASGRHYAALRRAGGTTATAGGRCTEYSTDQLGFARSSYIS